MKSNQRALRQEIAALQHELRRVSDGLERNRTRALELQARRLRDSIALCQRELQQLDTPLQSGDDRS